MTQAVQTSSAVVHTSDLSLEFSTDDGPVHALANINLDIAPGEFISLIGPSGCGKTTLLRVIADLETHTGGEIQVNGVSPQEARESRAYGYVFQAPALYPWRTVRRNVMLPLEIMGVSRQEREARCAQYLDLVNLSGFENKYPWQLSGGMQQRASIARALASNPQFIVCDEPTSALDVSVQAQVLNLLKQLQRDLQLTYLFISHDMAVVRVMAHRIGVLKDGRLVEENEAGKLIESPQQPYTRMLMESTPRFAGGVG